MLQNTNKVCKEAGETQKYIGETFRSSYKKASEHLKDLADGKDTSNMPQHIIEKHPDMQGTLNTVEKASEVFKIKMMRKHSNYLTRQMHKAIRIIRSIPFGCFFTPCQIKLIVLNND